MLSGNIQYVLGSGIPNAVQLRVAVMEMLTVVATGGVTMLAGSVVWNAPKNTTN